MDGFLRGAKYLIHDRDPLFSKAFIAILKAGGVKSVKIPARSPNCNPYAERFVKTIKYECLNHFVIFGERHLRHLINEFVEHYMTERFHQGIGCRSPKLYRDHHAHRRWQSRPDGPFPLRSLSHCLHLPTCSIIT